MGRMCVGERSSLWYLDIWRRSQKSTFPIRSICRSGDTTKEKTSPNEQIYCLMESCMVCWTLDARRTARTQCAKIWSIGTGYRTSDRLNQTPIQEVNLVHLPQEFLSMQTREDETMCAID